MNGGLIASPPLPSSSSVIIPPRIPSISCIKRCAGSQSWNSSSNLNRSSLLWNLKSTNSGSEIVSRISLRCNSNSNPGGPSGEGENESKSVLDAFFLGKALAEAINERVESAVGEFLSTIGRLQADQQRQVQDFQEDVLERARQAKAKAAREAMEAEGLVSKRSTRTNVVAVTDVVAGETTSTKPEPSNEED